jgi:hypothetical protein
VNGTCATITTPDCARILGDEWLNDDPEAEPYIFGALTRIGELEDDPYYWNLKLAMQEFSAHGRISIEGEERRPVLLVCHGSPDVTDREPLWRGLDQLIDGLGVSSILMLLASRPALEDLVRRTWFDRQDDVFFLDLHGATRALKGYYPESPDWDRGLLWHMQGDTDALAFPYVPLVERIEELVNPGASTGSAAEPTRLVVVTAFANEFDGEIAAVLSDFEYESPLRLNGMPVQAQLEQVRAVPYDTSDVGARIAEFEPHIVLDFGQRMMLAEEAFRDLGIPPPFYVLQPGTFRIPGSFDDAFVDYPSLRSRLVSLHHPFIGDPSLYQQYLDRLDASDAQDTPLLGEVEEAVTVYDAVYFLIYSAVAGGRGGTGKAAGFERLVVGPQRHIGPEGMASVLTRLANEADTLSLDGPAGNFGFDVPTGGRIAFANVWCIDSNNQFVTDALRYDHARLGFTGTLSCLDP